MRELLLNKEYIHFKGNVYITRYLAKDVNDPSVMYVIYEDYKGNVWARELSEFLSEVDKEKYPLVKQKYRFEEKGD